MLVCYFISWKNDIDILHLWLQTGLQLHLYGINSCLQAQNSEIKG